MMKDWIFVPFAIFVICATMGYADNPSQSLERQKEIQIERKLESLTQKAQTAQVEDIADLQDWLGDIRRQLSTVSRAAQRQFARSLRQAEGQVEVLKNRIFEEIE